MQEQNYNLNRNIFETLQKWLCFSSHRSDSDRSVGQVVSLWYSQVGPSPDLQGPVTTVEGNAVPST